jgi:hypothetical protein
MSNRRLSIANVTLLTFQVNFILQAAQMLLKLHYIYIYIYIFLKLKFKKKIKKFIGCPMLRVDSLVAQSFVLGSFFLGWGMWVETW